ncbi:alpha/beta hydrolase family esterase [Methylocella sp.]|uniref:extracellular catalytic domain type 1 short-chain-length polyhydroxyalkanoate depolymerase n=1 Tax=Methylocella sp. TaxID=1978226 RepID=UPI003784A314
MKTVFDGAMRKAVALTAGQNPVEATKTIQDALAAADPFRPNLAADRTRPAGLWKAADPLDAAEPKAVKPETAAPKAAPSFAASPFAASPYAGLTVGDLLDSLRERFASTDESVALERAPPPAADLPAGKPVEDGARFVNRSFSCAAGTRRYKLFVPSAAALGRPMPLVVMLHGCRQDADDFALGTGMNALAEANGFLVAYPRQSSSSNQMGCWNWFNLKDQVRESGEPAIIAGITREIMEAFPVDSERVFAAGLSAGGAMAAILSVNYPDLFKAVGIHSGLPCGAATDIASAFLSMKHGATLQGATPREVNVRTIVFQGGADRTVHPSNADLIVAFASAGLDDAEETRQTGRTPAGVSYERTVIGKRGGAPQVEYWAIPGLGHAWSGGYPEGSFTDQQGPDASLEMLRFFMQS